MYCSQKTYKKHKETIIKELAKLEKVGWNNPENEDCVFPYVLLEAINLLKNSEIIENPVDYTKTGKKAEELIESILNLN